MTPWWRSHGVRVRLTLWYVFAMVIVLAVYAVAIYVFVSRGASETLDQYLRGAFAEFAVFPFLPLVALGVLLVSEKHRTGVGLLAVAYAALLMTHLPTALLVSVTMLPFYVLFRAWNLGDRRAALGFLLRAGLAGVLGIGLAASYLAPAMLLQEWISAGML